MPSTSSAKSIMQPGSTTASPHRKVWPASKVGQAGPRRDVVALQELLSDCTVPVSLGSERPSMTFGAVVYECSLPARMWVAPGPPHVEAFRQMEWSSAREQVEIGTSP